MRKRSNYRPRGVRTDVISYVMSGITHLSALKSEVATLRIRNHGALSEICRGTGTSVDVDVLIAALNVAEALTVGNIGKEYAEQIRAGQDALAYMTRRGIQLRGKFIFKAVELQAINLAMDIHDAQLDVITVQQLERSLAYVKRVVVSGGARAIA